MKNLAGLILLLVIIGASALVVSAQSVPDAVPPLDWQTKVDAALLDAEADISAEMLVYLVDQADVSAAHRMTDKVERGTYVFETLSQHAARTQAPIVAVLEANDTPYYSFWVANMLFIDGDMEVVQALARMPEVAHIYANTHVALDEVKLDSAETFAPAAIEWGVAKINAPALWDLGYTGQGVVVGGQDTGYQWDHPALKAQYRGWNGSKADHNYHWHDAIHAIDPGNTGSNPCGIDIVVPCDDNSHGTHTMGTMVGDDGGSNQVGVAPGAEWISCRNMERGDGSPATYSECYQWFIAPTDLNNSNPLPAMAPDVINNSWSCPASEGCMTADVMQTVVENVRAAGIVTVHAASNAGSSCSTVNTPGGIYEASFTVGATNSSDVIANFSSRGPVTVDGSNRLKPEVSAPGVSVRSTVPGNSYSFKSGTSMAAPHVVGAIALLLWAEPELRGNVDAIEQVFMDTAVPRTTTQVCGGIPGSEIPNNTYGFGRIDVFEAVAARLSPELSIEQAGGGANSAELSWTTRGAVCNFEVHRSNTPYFTPSATSLLTTTTIGSYTDTTATGDDAVNNFYTVQAMPCAASAGFGSNQVGAWDYALAIGD